MDELHKITNKEGREEVKNSAVELREGMEYEESRRLFEEVLEWDESNSNVRGFADVCGHLSILYRKWADRFDDSQERRALKEKALKCCQKGLDMIDRHPEMPNAQGNASNLYVHMSMAYYDLALGTEDREEKLNKLKDALEKIERAEQLHAGTLASKGWLKKDKARILFELGVLENDQDKIDQAWQVLSEAQTEVNKGAKEELERDDQAKLKLSAWIGGIYLTYAQFHHKLGSYPVARIYCNLVLSSPDMSEIRKQEAEKLLDEVRAPE